ncbi:unnamed protein product, partial [Closterium sp. Yama58-4]
MVDVFGNPYGGRGGRAGDVAGGGGKASSDDEREDGGVVRGGAGMGGERRQHVGGPGGRVGRENMYASWNGAAMLEGGGGGVGGAEGHSGRLPRVAAPASAAAAEDREGEAGKHGDSDSDTGRRLPNRGVAAAAAAAAGGGGGGGAGTGGAASGGAAGTGGGAGAGAGGGVSVAPSRSPSAGDSARRPASLRVGEPAGFEDEGAAAQKKPLTPSGGGGAGGGGPGGSGGGRARSPLRGGSGHEEGAEGEGEGERADDAQGGEGTEIGEVCTADGWRGGEEGEGGGEWRGGEEGWRWEGGGEEGRGADVMLIRQDWRKDALLGGCVACGKLQCDCPTNPNNRDAGGGGKKAGDGEKKDGGEVKKEGEKKEEKKDGGKKDGVEEKASPAAAAAAGGKELMDGEAMAPLGTMKWKRGELLGEGAYGKVFLGLNEMTGELMAVKQIKMTSAGDEKAMHIAALEQEIVLYRQMRHRHIVAYIDMEKDESDGSLYIFLEFISGGSIHSMLDKFGKFSESLVRVYTRQLLLGLEYLHGCKIIHRDIKAATCWSIGMGSSSLRILGPPRRFTRARWVRGASRSVVRCSGWRQRSSRARGTAAVLTSGASAALSLRCSPAATRGPTWTTRGRPYSTSPRPPQARPSQRSAAKKAGTSWLPASSLTLANAPRPL